MKQPGIQNDHKVSGYLQIKNSEAIEWTITDYDPNNDGESRKANSKGFLCFSALHRLETKVLENIFHEYGRENSGDSFSTTKQRN